MGIWDFGCAPHNIFEYRAPRHLFLYSIRDFPPNFRFRNPFTYSALITRALEDIAKENSLWGLSRSFPTRSLFDELDNTLSHSWRRHNSLFSDFFDSPTGLFGSLFNDLNSLNFTKLTPVNENNDKDFELCMQLSDFKPEDIDIGIYNGIIRVSAKKNSNTEKEGQYRSSVSTSFSNSIPLPENLNLDGAKAMYNRDILTIKIPRA
ncbi:bifunctional HSP20-like chaperone/Alpha crystallin-Hsp20 domain [Babesia duncani]|uniref:Bifunctional HSP20-like chaperone/Alpha crystallin-Hsp20 domain n=1 Tax=Babesia duncani TaxID=323732 RepID=A0AAD9UNR8_9APIC|nr:bifunctional HSP20-like chaperone/Alpha crystallin-Hsp20 domain [Babesia duncani]